MKTEFPPATIFTFLEWVVQNQYLNLNYNLYFWCLNLTILCCLERSFVYRITAHLTGINNLKHNKRTLRVNSNWWDILKLLLLSNVNMRHRSVKEAVPRPISFLENVTVCSTWWLNLQIKAVILSQFCAMRSSGKQVCITENNSIVNMNLGCFTPTIPAASWPTITTCYLYITSL